MFVVLLVEVVEEYAFNNEILGPVIFSYFNVKLTAVLYEVWANHSWPEAYKNCRSGVFVTVYFLSMLAIQIFYSVPEESKKDTPAWLGVFWTATTIEFFIVLAMLVYPGMFQIVDNMHEQ